MLSFFPRDILDEIWDLIESFSESFLTYFCTDKKQAPISKKSLSIRRDFISASFVCFFKGLLSTMR